MLDVDQGQQHRTVIGDLTRLDVIREVVRIAADCGTITAIVNAVGISPKNSGEKINFFDITPELWDQVMEVNVKAPFLLIQQAAAHMPNDGTASIVNLLSVTSKWGQVDYRPTIPAKIAVYSGVCRIESGIQTHGHAVA